MFWTSLKMFSKNYKKKSFNIIGAIVAFITFAVINDAGLIHVSVNFKQKYFKNKIEGLVVQ